MYLPRPIRFSAHSGAVWTIQNTGVFWQAVFNQPPRPYSLFLEHSSAAQTLISHPQNTASYAGYLFQNFTVSLRVGSMGYMDMYKTCCFVYWGGLCQYVSVGVELLYLCLSTLLSQFKNRALLFVTISLTLCPGFKALSLLRSDKVSISC